MRGLRQSAQSKSYETPFCYLDRSGDKDLTTELISGIDDEQLLRALAEDVPEMAPEIRNQLRRIAQRLQQSEPAPGVRSHSNIVSRQREFELWWRSLGKYSSSWSPTPLTVEAFTAGYEAGRSMGDGR
jgi:hypothetical protein